MPTGPTNPSLENMSDLKGREITALMPIAALSIMLGFYPAPLLDVVNPAVDRTVEIVSVANSNAELTSEGSDQ
jgi:NADH-quinone oxidoreductase subunit M